MAIIKDKKFKLGVAIFIVVGILVYFYNHHNKLFVTVDNSLSYDKIRIEKGFYSINEHSDKNLIKQGLDEVIYNHGKKVKKFETVCGENDFLIIYDDKFYTIFRHLIPNNFLDAIPKPHTYNFNLKKVGDNIKITLNIEGEDGIKMERIMVKVADANKNVWGRQPKIIAD